MADDPPSFEETYPRYDFAELVRLAIAVGAWIGARRRAHRGKPPAEIAAADGVPTARPSGAGTGA